MTFLYANNARSQLVTGIDTDDTALTLLTGDGAKYPEPGVGEEFRIRLIQRISVDVYKMEILSCTARAGDELTVTRAVESIDGAAATAQTFDAGAYVELVTTAEIMESIFTDMDTLHAAALDYVDDSITVTPASDADVPLTANQEANGRLLLATGSWTTGRNIIVSANTRLFWVKNGSAYDAVVKTAAGTGETVKTGTARVLYCDGTNVTDPLSAYYKKIETYSASEVDAAIAAVADPHLFADWTGGTTGEDDAGQYILCTTTEPAYSPLIAIEEVPELVTLTIAAIAGSASDAYAIDVEVYDSSSVLLETKAVISVTAGNATASMTEATFTSVDVNSSATQVKIKVTPSVGTLKVYTADVTSVAGFGYGTLVSGTTIELRNETATFSATGTSTTIVDFRSAGAGTVGSRIEVTDGTFSDAWNETISLTKGAVIQLKTREFSPTDWRSRIFVDDVATGTDRSTAYQPTTGTLKIRVAGTLVDGTF